MNESPLTLIQCEDGSYINPIHYEHFFIYEEGRTVDGVSFTDYSIGANPQSHRSVTIWSRFKTMEDARKMLDEIMKKIK